jgi:hypothetical protein
MPKIEVQAPAGTIATQVLYWRTLCARQLARRKEIYEALHPETVNGGDRRSSRQNGDLKPQRFTKRNKHAALKLMRKLLKKYGFVPNQLITDDLRSYGVAARELGIESHHERGRWRNNRVENSHQPTRRRERKMQGFKSPGAQRFLSTHAAVYNIFNAQRHLTTAQTHRRFRAAAMSAWRDAVATAWNRKSCWAIAFSVRQRDNAIRSYGELSKPTLTA